MEISNVIAISALIISLVTLYLTHLRTVNKLYLVSVIDFDDLGKKFTVLNASNKNIIVFSIKEAFKIYDNDKPFFSYQKNKKMTEPLILEAGKSSTFLIDTDSTNIFNYKKGKKTTDGNYLVPLYLEVSWIDHKGVQFKNKTCVTEYFFDENGKEVKSTIGEGNLNVDLYDDAKTL